MTEPLLLTATQISTFEGQRLLTKASGFFFARDERLFLVTSRHVVIDEPSQHFPDRIEIELHTRCRQPDAVERPSRCRCTATARACGGRARTPAARSTSRCSRSTARRCRSRWCCRRFTPQHLPASFDDVEVGSPLLIVGFPLSFHDTLHHLPVVRQAAIASSFGVRFQGQGYFLTDARTHRGTSGAPVVMRAAAAEADLGDLPWKLLGVHAARMDMKTRDLEQDESLGLNCAWYADILLTLTAAEAGASTPLKGGT